MKKYIAAFLLLPFIVHGAYALSPPPPKPSLKKSGPVEKKSSPVELPLLSDPAPSSAAAPNDSVREYLDRASAFSAKGDWASAEENLRAAVRLDPQNADVVLDLARALMEQGKEDPALAVLTGYAGSDMRIAQAMGEAYVSTGRLKEAEAVFMDLSLRQPAEAFHRYNLGLVEYRMGKIDMAENAYLRAVELDPNFADAHYNLALLYIRGRVSASGAPSAGVSDVGRVSASGAPSAGVSDVGRDYPKALAHLEEAVRLKEDVEYLINYGVVLRELNRFPVSQAALERALAIEPANTLALNNLGITHHAAGNTMEAQKAFTEVLNVAPEDLTARSYLARMSAAPAVGAKTTHASSSGAHSKNAPPDNIPLQQKSPAGSAPRPPESAALRAEEKIRPPVSKIEPDRPTSGTSAPGAPEALSRPAGREMQSELMRLKTQNMELKERLADLEKRMDEIKRGVFKQMAQDEQAQSKRVDSALKKAQKRLEQKENELAEKANPTSMDAPASVEWLDQGGEVRDGRLDEIQRTLAQARADLEDVRRSQAPVHFSPEPGSTEERLDAADRAVQQLHRQIRQLTIERDMLRAEINVMTPAPGPSPSRGFGKTNVNLADLSALLMVPGMEERLAHNVLWYRQNIGPFRSVLDLKKVPGMDELHYSQMLDFVSVGSEAAQ